MVVFTNVELTDMHYMYGNPEEARGLYHERFSNRVLPESRTFSNTHCSLTGRGTFEENNQLKVANRNVRTPQMEEAVLN